jgi:UDP-glucuronate 4-epimerase
MSCNINGFLHILECCRRFNVPKLIYASSSSVYGGLTYAPFVEGVPICDPISLYAATKAADELMAKSYCNLYGMACVGLRYFTVIGPWGRPDMAIWLFTEAIREGRSIKLFNHGDMERDFTYIDDIVQGTLAAIDASACGHDIFNLGNNHAIPLKHIVGILEEEIGKSAMVENLPMQKGDMKATCADISKAKKILGFEPKTEIRMAIRKFVNWYEDTYGHRLGNKSEPADSALAHR